MTISPRCISCSGRKHKLPGEPVISVIEKFAVVGDTFPFDIDRLCPCPCPCPCPCLPLMRGIAVESGCCGDTDREEDVAPPPGAARPSSVMSIVMLLGGMGNIDDVVLIRFRALDDGISYADVAVDGPVALDIESYRSCFLASVVPDDELLNDDDAECGGGNLIPSSVEFALDLESSDLDRGTCKWACVV